MTRGQHGKRDTTEIDMRDATPFRHIGAAPTTARAIAFAAAALLVAASCSRATDEAAATRTLGDVVSAVPCVTRHDITYNDLPGASGAISGKVHVSDAACFERVLQALATLPDFNRSRGTTVYVSGVLPDGGSVVPQAFGLTQPPSLRDLRRRYAGGS